MTRTEARARSAFSLTMFILLCECRAFADGGMAIPRKKAEPRPRDGQGLRSARARECTLIFRGPLSPWRRKRIVRWMIARRIQPENALTARYPYNTSAPTRTKLAT